MQRFLAISLSLTAVLVIAATSYYSFAGQQNPFPPNITQVLQPAIGTQTVVADSSDSIAAEERNKARKLYEEGNYKEAYESYVKIATNPKAGGQPLVSDLSFLQQCIQRMRYYSQWEDLIEKVIVAQGNDWRVLQAVA